MTGLRLRLEVLADDSLVVVRGGELDPDGIRDDAVRTFRRFGEYGVSVLAVPSEEALDELARTTLLRFEVLTLVRAGTLRAVGLELRPTFRRPHYTVMLPALDDDTARLVQCDNVRWSNPYFRPEEVEE